MLTANTKNQSVLVDDIDYDHTDGNTYGVIATLWSGEDFEWEINNVYLGDDEIQPDAEMVQGIKQYLRDSNYTDDALCTLASEHQTEEDRNAAGWEDEYQRRDYERACTPSGGF